VLLLEEGLAGIASGVLTLVWPAIMALVLLYLIAAWAIVTGVIEIAAAFSEGCLLLRRGRWHWLESSPCPWVYSLIVRPGVGLLSLTWLMGAYAIVFGVILIILAIQFRTAVTA
jgi:uncharacterized membrane protein HdeD (DUF308 family)